MATKAEQTASGLDDEKKSLLARAEAAEQELMQLRAAHEQTQSAYGTAMGAVADLQKQNAQLQRMLRVSENATVGDRSRLVIVCRTPGFRRGGVVHPLRAEYPLNAFSSAQLEAFRREPELDLIEIGGKAQPNGLDTDHGPGKPFHDPANFGWAIAKPDVIAQTEIAIRAEEAGSATAGIEAQAAVDMARLETGPVAGLL